MSEAEERARLCGCNEPTWHGGQPAPRTYTMDEVRALMLAAWHRGDHQHFNRRPDPEGDVEGLLNGTALRP